MVDVRDVEAVGDAIQLVMDYIEGGSLGELRAAMERHGAVWTRILAQDLDTDAAFVEHDGAFERRAPIGIRLAQALHHGTDHRSQICTALTVLGVAPPLIDVWDYGLHSGRSVESGP